MQSNGLNKSIQGLWISNNRNSLPTPPQGSAAYAASQAVEKAAQAQVGNKGMTEHKQSTEEGNNVDDEGNVINVNDDQQQLNNSDQSNIQKKRKSKSSKETSSKRTKSATSSSMRNKDKTPPAARLSDLGGVNECVERMLELVAMPLTHPEIYLHTGVQPPRGVLLHGPPGCGKTLLANAIAGEMGVPFLSISAPSVVSGMSGESEKTIRDTFEEAINNAPCLLFIDEIDAITPKRENAQREMERRIVAQLLTCIDDISWDKTDNKPVIIIGATNRPDSLDAALRRAGRFDHEISMGVPDDKSREQILKVLCSKLKLSGDFDFRTLAKRTPGYVGADLSALTGAAGVIAVKRIFKQLAVEKESNDNDSSMEVVNNDNDNDNNELNDNNEVNENEYPLSSLKTLASHLPKTSVIAQFLINHPHKLSDEQLSRLSIESIDFEEALKIVQPSSKREGFATVPDVTWNDIGALHTIRDELHMAIVQPVLRPELFEMIGINAPCGVLLWGPPGCGKTLLAKAVANESRANFISVKGPELLNKYVGESERAIRQVFNRARASSPCVIFFDELDALVPRRDDNLSESSARVVNTLLTELDGLESRKQVFVIGATNRPDIIDPAMVRPGRLDKLLYVDLPTPEERSEVIITLSSSSPILPTDITSIKSLVSSEKCTGFSGADLAALVRESAVISLRESIMNNNNKVTICLQHFEKALEKVSPSVSHAQVKKYDHLRAKFAGLPTKTNSKRRNEEDI